MRRAIAIIGAGPVGLAAGAHIVERGMTPIILEQGSGVGHVAVCTLIELARLAEAEPATHVIWLYRGCSNNAARTCAAPIAGCCGEPPAVNDSACA